jgi:ABC-type sugar transport system ATPase subunit
MARMSLKNVVKRYPRAKSDAVKGISFDVEEGELLVILGPSGCGKTSTLRMIAGLESVTSGEITFDGRQVNLVAPARRNVAMAFENYGLYEHWSVFDNVAYPLRLRGTSGPELERTVRDVAAKLQISQYLGVQPTDLSGGMRQRIGLARALVRKPSVFLLDEPISHVDADLRNDMRAEIKRIHQEVGSTMIIVTHDQLDALAMADRILVMNHGEIEQHDRPEAIYRWPATVFVAGFIGEPPMNMVSANLEGNMLRMANTTIAPVPTSHRPAVGPLREGTQLMLAFRPHAVEIHKEPPAATLDELVLEAKVYMVEPLGDRTLVTLSGPSGLLKVDVSGGYSAQPDTLVWLSVRGVDVQLFDAVSGRGVAVGAGMPAAAAR